MGASVHITLREGLEVAEARVHTTRDEGLMDRSPDRETSLGGDHRERMVELHHDYLGWVSERTRCCGLDFVQDPSAPRRWAANEEMAIDLLRRVAAHHGW